MMRKKLHVKKGDNVIVISGEDKGHKGRILEVDVKNRKAIVEGANIISKHTKPNAEHPNGGIIKKEAFMHISKLMQIDPKSGTKTRIGRKLNDKNKLVRYSKKSGEEIK